MKRLFQTVLAGLALLLAAGVVSAGQPDTKTSVQAQAETLAKSLVTACPIAAYNDETAFQACAKALHAMTLPFEPAIAWGGDQPDKQIKKKGLTQFQQPGLSDHVPAVVYFLRPLVVG